VRHLRALQDESAPPLRPPPAHARPRPTLGVPVHRLYHRPAGRLRHQRRARCRVPPHQDGALHRVHQVRDGQLDGRAHAQPHVVKLHGLPDDIVSDRGPQFASRFWRRLLELLGTKSKLSTAFHPQTNGQAERPNQVLEQYLRCFVNTKQSNWTTLLPMAEFAYNNTVQASTGHSPFYAVYGHHPRFDLNMPATAVNPAAEERARDLEQIHADLKVELRASQESAAKYANARRAPGPAIAVGDMVWLRRKNIKSTNPCPKLDTRKIGPGRSRLRAKSTR
jgi:transposase InsO family protein